jgi:hypothetical protein
LNPKPTFEETSGVYTDDDRPLFKREVDWVKLSEEIRALA